MLPLISETRFRDFLHFGQPFKAVTNNLPILPRLYGNFRNGVKIIHFSIDNVHVLFGVCLARIG